MTDKYKEYTDLLVRFHSAISAKQQAGEDLKQAKKIFEEADQALQIAETELNNFEKEYI